MLMLMVMMVTMMRMRMMTMMTMMRMRMMTAMTITCVLRWVPSVGASLLLLMLSGQTCYCCSTAENFLPKRTSKICFESTNSYRTTSTTNKKQKKQKRYQSTTAVNKVIAKVPMLPATIKNCTHQQILAKFT